jgi:hypothetical protein
MQDIVVQGTLIFDAKDINFIIAFL